MYGAGLDGKNWNHFCAKKHAKVKQRVRKGIPDAVRGLTWQLLAGSRELVQLNPGDLTVHQLCPHYTAGWHCFHFSHHEAGSKTHTALQHGRKQL